MLGAELVRVSLVLTLYLLKGRHCRIQIHLLIVEGSGVLLADLMLLLKLLLHLLLSLLQPLTEATWRFQTRGPSRLGWLLLDNWLLLSWLLNNSG